MGGHSGHPRAPFVGLEGPAGTHYWDEPVGSRPADFPSSSQAYLQDTGAVSQLLQGSLLPASSTLARTAIKKISHRRGQAVLRVTLF
jgi:hypothetical protein